MKIPYALAAVLAILILSFLSACGNLSSSDSNADTYVVTYFPNGAVSGTVPADTTSYSVGQTVTVAGNTGGLAKTGYAYSGWNTKTDGTGTTYTQGQTFAIGEGDVTLYARWTTNPTYTVTYSANGATGGTAPTDTTHYEVGKAVTVAGNTGSLTKTGYAFAGWNTVADGSGTDRATGSTFTMGSADVTLYAKWTAGVAQTFTAGGITFDMRMVPGYTGFPTGADDAGTATVSAPYWMAETEVTYELWYAVRTWAAANGYTFANQGREGHDGVDGAALTAAKNEPATYFSWRDALVWCNAMTEWYNANNGSEPDLDPVYYTDDSYAVPLRTATNSGTITYTTPGTEDQPYIKAAAAGNTDQVNCTAKGFRLPMSMEWELAARWRTGGTNTVAGYSNPWFTKGNSASGATAAYTDAAASGAVAWYDVNSGSVSHDVKGKTATSLSLYDMSGNVWEWCFDWNPAAVGSWRVNRGGSWYKDDASLQVGILGYVAPYLPAEEIGLRIARNP